MYMSTNIQMNTYLYIYIYIYIYILYIYIYIYFVNGTQTYIMQHHTPHTRRQRCTQATMLHNKSLYTNSIVHMYICL